MYKFVSKNSGVTLGRTAPGVNNWQQPRVFIVMNWVERSGSVVKAQNWQLRSSGFESCSAP